MFNKIINIIKRNLNIFNINQIKLLFHFSKLNNAQNEDGFILADHFEVDQNLIYRSIVLNELSKVKNSKVLIFNNKYNFNYRLSYKKLGFKNLNIKLNFSQRYILEKIYKKFTKKIKNKKDLLNYKINNINLGWDIFESYLIRNQKPQVEINDPKLGIIAKEAIGLYIFWKEFFENNKVTGIFLSHRMYVETNILNRIAILKKIPCYTIAGDGSSLMKIQTLSLNIFNTYKKLFKMCNKKKKKEMINKSKKLIFKKLSGVVGVNMDYSKASAFTNFKFLKNPIEKSKKVNILICTHCFYDNPLAYGKNNFFLDFYDWLQFLAKISHSTNYNWFIKPHPDYLPGTMEILYSIGKNFKNLKFVNNKASFKQITQNLDVALTVYGSVAHELPLLGVKVINASKDNPHKCYNFSVTPKNKTHYEKILKNLKKTKNYKVNKDEVFQFYFMHNNFFKTNLFQKFNEILKNNEDNTYKSANIYFERDFYKQDQKISYEFFNSENKVSLKDNKIINYFNKISDI